MSQEAQIQQLTEQLRIRGEQLQREGKEGTEADAAQVRQLTDLMRASNRRLGRELRERERERERAEAAATPTFTNQRHFDPQDPYRDYDPGNSPLPSQRTTITIKRVNLDGSYADSEKK